MLTKLAEESEKMRLRAINTPGGGRAYNQSDYQTLLDNDPTVKNMHDEEVGNRKRHFDQAISPTSFKEGTLPRALGGSLLGAAAGGFSGRMDSGLKGKPLAASIAAGAGIGTAFMGGLGEHKRRKGNKNKETKSKELLDNYNENTKETEKSYITPGYMANMDALQQSYNEHYASNDEGGLSKMANPYTNQSRNDGFHRDLNYIDPQQLKGGVNVQRFRGELEHSPEMQRAFDEQVEDHMDSRSFKFNRLQGSAVAPLLAGTGGAIVGADMARNIDYLRRHTKDLPAATRQQQLRGGLLGAALGAGALGTAGILQRNAKRGVDQEAIDAMERETTYATPDSIARAEALRRDRDGMEQEASHQVIGLTKYAEENDHSIKNPTAWGSAMGGGLGLMSGLESGGGNMKTRALRSAGGAAGGAIGGGLVGAGVKKLRDRGKEEEQKQASHQVIGLTKYAEAYDYFKRDERMVKLAIDFRLIQKKEADDMSANEKIQLIQEESSPELLLALVNDDDNVVAGAARGRIREIVEHIKESEREQLSDIARRIDEIDGEITDNDRRQLEEDLNQIGRFYGTFGAAIGGLTGAGIGAAASRFGGAGAMGPAMGVGAAGGGLAGLLGGAGTRLAKRDNYKTGFLNENYPGHLDRMNDLQSEKYDAQSMSRKKRSLYDYPKPEEEVYASGYEQGLRAARINQV